MKIDEMLHKVMSSLLPTSISVIVSSSDLMDSQILNFKYAFNQIFEENLICYLLCLLLQVKLNDNWKFFNYDSKQILSRTMFSFNILRTIHLIHRVKISIHSRFR